MQMHIFIYSSKAFVWLAWTKDVQVLKYLITSYYLNNQSKQA